MTTMTETSRGRVRTEPSQKRVRAYLSGQLVVDSIHPVLVWEKPYYPTYYFPAEDVRAELLATGRVERSPSRGDGQILDVKVGSATAPGAAQRFPDSPLASIRPLVRLDWGMMTEWLEEDEPVYTHPRDPHTRVDILTSSRHVRVDIDGVTVAESHRPTVLFETGLPPRYYLPLAHLRMDLLRPSATTSQCPYKGTASYWTLDTGVGVHQDIVWTYRAPLPESQKIAGLACFYNEKVDMYIDGERYERPHTQFG